MGPRYCATGELAVLTSRSTGMPHLHRLMQFAQGGAMAGEISTKEAAA